jgi:hypothetical protein
MTYAKYLISWFKFAGLDIQDKFIEQRKGRYFRIGEIRLPDNRETFTPQQRPEKDIEVFRNLKDQSKVDNFKKLYHSLYDLKSIGLVTYSGNKVFLTDQGKLILKKIGEKEFKECISTEALKTKKIKQATEYFSEHPKCTREEFKKALPTAASNIKSEAHRKQIYNVLYSWAKFIYAHLDKAN